MALPIRSQDLFIEFVANLKSQLEVSVGDERVSCHFLSFGVPISHMRLNARKGWMRGEPAEAPSLPGAVEGPGGDSEARLEPPGWFIVRQGPQPRSRPRPGVAL